MKKIGISTIAAVMLLSLSGLVSCINETETPDNGHESITTRSVVFNISLPMGDPIHVKTRTPIQENAEVALTSLNLLVFDAATDVLKSIVTVDLTDDVTSTGFGTGNDYQYDYTWDPENDGTTCRFLFVANESVSLTAGTSTWTDALAAVSSAALTFESGSNQATVFANGLPMTGIAYYGEGNAKNEVIPIDATSLDTPVNVDLTRLVARVDIYNKTPNLHITGLCMVHANPQSYLLPHKDGSNVTVVPTGMTKVGGATGGLLPYNNLLSSNPISASNPFTGATGDGVELKQAFYVYEDDIYENSTPALLEAEALALQITGKLGTSVADGVDVFYQIPFIDLYKEGGADDDKSVEIKRNYLYKVNIGDGSSIDVNSLVRASVVVADWDGTPVNSTFEDALFSSEPLAAVGTYNRDTHLITLASDGAVGSGDLTIDVTDTYNTSVTITGVEVLTSGSTWEAAGSTTGWLSAAIATGDKSITLTATANTSGATRIGSIRITYSYVDGSNVTQTGAKIVFSVKQPSA